MVETEEAAKKDATYYVENIRIHDLALLHLLINWRTSMDTGTNTLFFMYREPPSSKKSMMMRIRNQNPISISRTQIYSTTLTDFYSVPGNYRDFVTFNFLGTVVD